MAELRYGKGKGSRREKMGRGKVNERYRLAKQGLIIKGKGFCAVCRKRIDVNNSRYHPANSAGDAELWCTSCHNMYRQLREEGMSPRSAKRTVTDLMKEAITRNRTTRMSLPDTIAPNVVGEQTGYRRFLIRTPV